MKVLILGAAGEIGQMVTDLLLNETDADIVLYARNASRRLKAKDESRETIVDGDFNDAAQLDKAMKGVDIVYLNSMGDKKANEQIVKTMKSNGIKHIIGATILGIYGEVPGKFGQWNQRMVGAGRIKDQAESAEVFENSDLDYTLLRLTWLYNEAGNEKYMTTTKGEPFVGAQVTRQAVSRLILDIITAKDNRYSRQSLGVSEPDTDWDKPSFY